MAKGRRFLSFAHFYLINYEATFSELDRLRALMGIRRMAVVLDESHAIKNPDTLTARTIMGLRDGSPKRIIITGTPVANKPLDLWCQYFFLDGGELLGKSFNDFEKRFTPVLSGSNLKSNEPRFADLRRLIEANSIRRMKDDVLELPEKSFKDVPVTLNPRQQTMYDELRKELRLSVTTLGGEIELDEASDLFKRLLRLVQVASNPRLVDPSYTETPAKFEALDGLVQQIVRRGEKVIVWTTFVDNVRALRRRYAQHGAGMIHGGVSTDDRRRVVRRFKDDSEMRVLVANPAAAREGLTLTSANNAIYLDRSFNMVDYLQSQDRIHRISQTKPCLIQKLLARETIDEYVDELLYKKHRLAGFLQGDAANLTSARQFLTRTQLLDMLGS
jgi:SNF2 family DNA or RNA helicase